MHFNDKMSYYNPIDLISLMSIITCFLRQKIMQRNISIIYSSENRFLNFKQIGDMVIIPIYSLLYSVLVAVKDSVHIIIKRICCK